MKKVVIFLATLLVFATSVQSQELRRNVFHGGIKSRGGLGWSLPLLGRLILSPGSGDILMGNDETRWMTTTSEFDMHVPAWSMTNNKVDVPLGAPRWWSFFLLDRERDYNFSYGYEVSWKCLVLPIGAYLGVDYEFRQVNIEEGMLAGRHKTQSVIPSFGLRLRLLGVPFERQHNWNIILDGGAAYDYKVRYRNFYKWDRSALNNGFRLRVGVGVATLKHGAFYARWEKDMYNMFNTDVVLSDGSKPIQGYENQFSSLILGWALFM